MTKYRICLIAVLLVSIGMLGVLSGYFFLTPNPEEVKSVDDRADIDVREVSADTGERIGENTKIVYEYVYLGGHKEYNETLAPKNWQGLSLSEFKDIFDGWYVKEFSGEEVRLSKNMRVYSPKHYVLGVHDGYVAVFQKSSDNEDRVKEITQTPVESLPDTEQKRLETGIEFYGDGELVKILEDYET